MQTESQNKETPESFSLSHHNHVGPILGVLIVVLVLILGGLYLWGSMIAKNEQRAYMERSIPNNEPETTRANTDKQILDTTSSSNDLDAIYADLESTNLDDLDSELGQIDVEMGAELR